ncbi:DUF1697 domain-containing protein [Nocardioides sp. MAH-18]|uniref:DUF1697 domain-containing protein n=1 Tax=Nocardioides agri TaxID=2682843 RepID=A0A6L6XTH9_9ACTN|nr:MULTISPECIES: DUF1697 domain-containing protein [unclassified Nocardioides]MBA2955458.1 DUF1697 domain-containing protein [Nocardioides sp. CGMCC 1.13656]MVQ50308.1 DUF1697 domain-containing protein [Nocardioides sp. MAH-18]
MAIESYVVLLRGINVGGRNKVPMAALREHLDPDFARVRSYIQTGNVVLDSDLSAAEIQIHIQHSLPKRFELDLEPIRVLVLDSHAYRSVLAEAPAGFGAQPETYRYDVGFYMGVSAAEVEQHIVTNPEVDAVHCGERAFYHRRVTALASRSRVSKIIGTPVYASLTIRNWKTTEALGRML